MGAGYSYRYETCSTWCFIAPVAQVGFGVSTMGPFVELNAIFYFFWRFRVDVATHFYFLKNRVMTWSYPFWLGVSLKV